MTLDDEGLNAMVGEAERGREAYDAASDDEDGHSCLRRHSWCGLGVRRRARRDGFSVLLGNMALDNDTTRM